MAWDRSGMVRRRSDIAVQDHVLHSSANSVRSSAFDLKLIEHATPCEVKEHSLSYPFEYCTEVYGICFMIVSRFTMPHQAGNYPSVTSRSNSNCHCLTSSSLCLVRGITVIIYYRMAGMSDCCHADEIWIFS